MAKRILLLVCLTCAFLMPACWSRFGDVRRLQLSDHSEPAVNLPSMNSVVGSKSLVSGACLPVTVVKPVSPLPISNVFHRCFFDLPRKALAMSSKEDSTAERSSGGAGKIQFLTAAAAMGAATSPDLIEAAEFLTYNYFDADLSGPFNIVKRGGLRNLWSKSLRERCQEEGPPSALIIAREGDELVGCAMLVLELLDERSKDFRKLAYNSNWQFFRSKTMPVLCNLVVRKDRRGRGLGRQLLLAVEAQATAWKYPELYLKVEAANERARQLYESSGYTVKFEKPTDTVVVPGNLFLARASCVSLYMAKRLLDEAPSDLVPAESARGHM